MKKKKQVVVFLCAAVIEIAEERSWLFVGMNREMIGGTLGAGRTGWGGEGGGEVWL